MLHTLCGGGGVLEPVRRRLSRPALPAGILSPRLASETACKAVNAACDGAEY